MKKNFILSLVAIFFGVLLFNQVGNAQIRIYEEGSYIKVEIDEEQKEAIMLTATKTLNNYARVATFRDENNEFSDQSYAEFVGLFSGSAEVYNDLAKKNNGNINYATYADNVFQYLQGTGVKFELNNTYLDEITYDSSGFYQVIVSFEKIMFNGLDDKNQLINFPNKGKVVELIMKIEIPEYDLSQASILAILGEAKKVKVESATLVSVDLNYHLGNVSKQVSVFSPGWNEDLPVNYFSYGADIIYRKSLNNKKSLYALAGVSLGFHNFTSSISGASAESIGEIKARVGGSALTQNASTVNYDSPTIKQIFKNPDNLLQENLSVIDLQIPIGISMRIIEKYNWDIFLDMAIVPTYSISSFGRYIGTVKYIQFPTDRTHFNDNFEEYVISEFILGNEIEGYFGEEDFKNELVSTAQKFSASAQVSPIIHYKFNFRMAIEFGMNINYGFTPYFHNETNHLSSDLSQILNITEQAGSENPSILQNNYKNVTILRYGARLGIVIKL